MSLWNSPLGWNVSNQGEVWHVSGGVCYTTDTLCHDIVKQEGPYHRTVGKWKHSAIELPRLQNCEPKESQLFKEYSILGTLL